MKNIKKITFILLWLSLCSFAFGQEKSSNPVKILFIGNSYTYQNNLPKLLTEIAATTKAPVNLQTRLISQGGFTLMSHWNNGEAARAIRSEKWDYVVLQEQSTLGMLYINGFSSINDPDKFFFKYARMFDKEIKRSGAKTVFMLTWAPKSQPEHQVYLTYAYMTIAKELKALVVPVGVVWEAAAKTRDDLYDSDGNHPSPTGSYLAASLFYATLFNGDPTGAVNLIQGHTIKNDGTEDAGQTVELAALKKEDAAWIQSFTWKNYQDLKKKGGYTSGVRPKPTRLPTLPAGLPATGNSFIGTCRGTINFYAVDYKMSPATMELVIGQTPGGLNGNLRVEFTGARESEAVFTLKNIEVRNNTLFFVTPPKKYDNQDVFYQGVLTKNGLEGIVRSDNEKTGGIGIGTWKCRQ